MKIQSVSAFQIYDSRGNPTIEAEVSLENGMVGRGLVPSGASTGQFEALELRDGDPDRFRGKSVFKAIGNILNEIAPAIKGRNVLDQRGLDETLIQLDGTQEKSRLGANALLAVSMAAANASALAQGLPLFRSLGSGTILPLPEIQIFGGGAHAHWRTDIQDFLIIAKGAKTYEESLEMTFHVFHAAGDLMRKRGTYFGVADEGGYWPEFKNNQDVFEALMQSIENAGYTPGEEIAISLDIAASDLFDAETGLYRLRLDDRSFDSDAFAELLMGWCEKYPVISIEDPMADTDLSGWEKFSKALSHRIQIIGDDLFTTNLTRIRSGIDKKLANAVLIKLNQIGTVTETLDAITLTQEAGWNPVVSARSGETEDAFITHLAVATNAGQLKVGSFSRSERMAKWNEGLRIARQLGKDARFLGWEGF